MGYGARRWASAAVGAVLLLLGPAAAQAQSDGAGVLRTALERYQSRLEGVQGVTIVQRTRLPMGGAQRVETRLEKRMVDGRPLLLPEGETGGEGAESGNAVTGIYANLPQLVDQAALRGRSTVDGQDVYVVDVTGLQEMDLGQGALSSGRGGSFVADSATLYLDSERYLLRRADMHGRMSTGMGQQTVSVRAHFRDFRNRGGYVHPFRMEAAVRIEGMGEKMGAMMEKMQEAGADSAQRAKLEQAAGAMMGGEMKVGATVEEVRVTGTGGTDGG